MRAVVIIQARMDSKRLPSKVLKEIQGKPMLWHLINRINSSKFINDIIISTTYKKEDDDIENFAKKHSFNIYRCEGDPDDLINRFYLPSKLFNADIVVRTWGDCPLIYHQIIDQLLKRFIEEKYDFANNYVAATGFNFEIYTFKTLETIWKSSDPFYRRFPREYVYGHKDLFNIFSGEKKLKDICLTVDYLEDFELVTDIFDEQTKQNKTFDIDDIIGYMRNHHDKRSQTLERNIKYKKEKKIRGII
ncbi:unnamed protein product [marine sediment metagenome]|uniref:Acylneuraminate cytidylyltransferase n=1 Tax=marine sediment metagenome TaxID=412755 RepID=X0UAQ2_9ZZZZ